MSLPSQSPQIGSMFLTTELSSYLKESTKGKDNDYLREILKTAIEEAIKLGPAKLKEHGEREVRRCVRDVMLTVTFSLYRGADLFIVLYRNCAMVVRLINIFALRPRWNELIRILGHNADCCSC